MDDLQNARDSETTNRTAMESARKEMCARVSAWAAARAFFAAFFRRHRAWERDALEGIEAGVTGVGGAIGDRGVADAGRAARRRGG